MAHVILAEQRIDRHTPTSCLCQDNEQLFCLVHLVIQLVHVMIAKISKQMTSCSSVSRWADSANACDRYQDYQAEDIPTVKQDGVSVRIMAGSHNGVTGPIVMRNPGLLMDVTVSKNANFSQEVGYVS